MITATPAGSKVQNTATATYEDGSGQSYVADSNPVITTYAPVGALTVTPKESKVDPATDAYAAGSNVTRAFTITNVSNVTDAYTIQTASTGPGKLLSAAFVAGGASYPATIGSTVSPSVPPGDSIELQIVVSTGGIALRTAFPLSITAQTTVAGTSNGLQSDTGMQWALAAQGPQFTGIGGPATQISKTVDQQLIVQSNPGADVTFDIRAKNSGEAAATNVVVTDVVPAGLQANLSSVLLDGSPAGSAATLSGRTLSVRIPSVAAGATFDVSFTASVLANSTTGATFTNVAQVAADGVSATNTTPASVLIGTANLVFDPSNADRPVGAAVVTLLDANGKPVNMSGVPPVDTANTQNPFTTGANGAYSFAVAPSMIAPGGSQFFLTITAPGFMNRKIGLIIKLDAGKMLYDVTASSLDGQPLAQAGGFVLTSANVTLANVFGLFGNVPLFTARSISVSKAVDKPVAQPGDRLIYTIQFGNPSQSGLGETQVADVLPPGESYAPGTARMDSTPLEPSVNGRVLTWNVPALPPSTTHDIVYAALVFPSAVAGTTLVNTVTASAKIPGTAVSATAGATADVRVVAGAFSQRGVITGRVFLDVHRTGRFSTGDEGIAGVRIFLEDGSSVLTDQNGRYSFAAVRPGMHVLRVDPATIPQTVRPFSNARMNSTWSMQRLVHGLFDDGLMEDVNFALQDTR